MNFQSHSHGRDQNDTILLCHVQNARNTFLKIYYYEIKSLIPLFQVV